MKIGIDVRMISHPGIGRYIKSLLPELIRQAPRDEFVLFGKAEKVKDLLASSNVRVLEWDAPIYSPWEQFFAVYEHTDIDVLHVPHFNIPVFFRKKLVVTIHDLIYLLFPRSVPSPVARYYARFMINQALKKAEKVISVSKNTKKDITDIFGKKYGDKVEVIYEACGKEFGRVEDKARIADVRCRYRLEEDIILYVGSVKPHKDIETLIRTFALLKGWGIPHQLVLAGRWDDKENFLKEKMSDRNIRYLGEVPTEDLVVLYSMADVLVHLSLYEGFGLTVLEAMQCGTPVVVSDTSSLPEVVGEAAFKVQSKNYTEIADTIYNVLVNKELRSGMIEAGLENVKRFSWEDAARDTLRVYHNT